MIRGIIYKYTSPSGKVYIGQTINEKDRRKHFLIQRLSYGGIKIDTAAAVNAAVEPWRSKVTKMEIASVAGMVGLEAERRMCADNKIVNYANNTFYPIRVAAVEVGTDTVQRSLYNPLCPCAGYSNSILFEPTTTPAA